MGLFGFLGVLSPVHMGWVRIWTGAQYIGEDQAGGVLDGSVSCLKLLGQKLGVLILREVQMANQIVETDDH